MIEDLEHGNSEYDEKDAVPPVAFVTKHGNKCAQGPYCRHFFLHKFRHTFATEHLRHGVDIRTLQSWMGHRDIKSTMVYLKGVQSKDALAKVNAGALARYVA